MASGWTLWVWLECIDVVSGCCCKEVYRYPHNNYYFSLLYPPFHMDTVNRFSAFTWATYPVLNPVIMALTRFQNSFENLVRNRILNQFVGA